MDKRKQFTFYRSYYEAIVDLSKKDQTSVLLAICAYALDAKEPDLKGTASAVFKLIKPTLDASREKAKSGKKGGESKQTASKPQANEKQTAREKENEKENEYEIEKEDECQKNALADVVGHYQQFINSAPNPMIVDDIREYLETMDADVIKNAFDRAASEGKRQHSYIRGILRSWRDKGIRNMADLARADADWERKRQAQAAAREQKMARSAPMVSVQKPPTSDDLDRMRKVLDKINAS